MEYRKVIDAFKRFATGASVELNVKDPLLQVMIADKTVFPIDKNDLDLLEPFFSALYDEYIQVGANKLHINDRLVDTAIVHIGDLHCVLFPSLEQMKESIRRLWRVIVHFEYLVDEADGFYEEQGKDGDGKSFSKPEEDDGE